MLFDLRERTDHTPASHVEDEFTFVDRSARPAAARVRQLLERWASTYPEPERAALRARLQAEFQATFFEMFLYEILRVQGCVVRLHPSLIEASSSRPDFIAKFPDGNEVVMEARVATDVSDEERRRSARLGVLYDQINKIESSRFLLQLKHVTDVKTAQPSGRRIREFIEERLAALDPDEVAADFAVRGSDALPVWRFKENGFELVVSVIPKSPPVAVGAAKPRAIGSYPIETRWGGSTPSIRAAILRKVGKYGPLDLPFVIAVNTLSSWGTNSEDVLDVLFGSRQVEWSPETGESRLTRAPDGVWQGSDGPRNRHLSAVLVSFVAPWNLAAAPIRLYHNPHATRPCTELNWAMSQALPANGQLVWTDGVPVGAALGLDPTWPGPLFGSSA